MLDKAQKERLARHLCAAYLAEVHGLPCDMTKEGSVGAFWLCQAARIERELIQMQAREIEQKRQQEWNRRKR